MSGVATYTRNTQPVFVASPNGDGDMDDGLIEEAVPLPEVNHDQVR